MPLQPPPSACATPGCAGLAPYGTGDHCPDCKRRRHRRFGRSWQRTRERILDRDPICRWAEQTCYQESTHVDHVIPYWDGGGDDDENLQGLCAHHHNEKTRREQQERRLAR